MTNDACVKLVLGENTTLIWQITPAEMPDDMVGMFPMTALELHFCRDDGLLHLFQMHIQPKENPKQWYKHVYDYTHFIQSFEED